MVLAAITEDYADRPSAAEGIEKAIREYYEGNGKKEADPQEGDDHRAVDPELIDRAVKEAVDVYNRNVFPAMKIGWGTYPSHIGHTLSKGCFRCHDDEHESDKGNIITQDCDLCHDLLAMEEEEPEILELISGSS